MTSQRATPSPGFALIAAISLMSFVLLLLLSFSTLLSVEVASTQNNMAQTEAREKARLAMLMALGQLQKHAGPDQRVTARAEILGDGNSDPRRLHWTGVWDATNPTAPPVWLVSGDVAQMQADASAEYYTFVSGHDHDGNGQIDGRLDFPETSAPYLELSDQVRVAWWTSDEGVKAPVTPVEGILHSLSEVTGDSTYLDYNIHTLQNAQATHDPAFDFQELYDVADRDDPTAEILLNAINGDQLEYVTANLDATARAVIDPQFTHAVALRNQFVLSNVMDGGLKKDLSYLKTLDTDDDPQTLYNDPDGLIPDSAIQLVQFKADPTAGDADDMLGMQLDTDTVDEALQAESQFTLAPVITEFQLSAGVAAEDGNLNRNLQQQSGVFLVHKLYLEIWNPYTVPMLVGDPNMPVANGYSDLRFVVSNLPDYSIRNLNTGATVSGSLPDLSYTWSDYANRKILRPGMVYLQTLPLDSGGQNDTGTLHQDLNRQITGSVNDTYTGQFTFGPEPVIVTLFGLNSAGDEKEIFRAEISGYPNFQINYDPGSRATWFKRVPTSESGLFGMNDESLERVGYAFAFRFKMLDEQEAPGTIQDISNLLSRYDVRQPYLEVDLSTWDINDAWNNDSPLPYDFRLNDSDTDPGYFDPAESFKDLDFFNYEFSTGRRDRVARFIDYPTSEVSDIGIFRTLRYRQYYKNALGNAWGEELNSLYDRYFFSTLPDPNVSEWDGQQPLLNARLQAYGPPVQLMHTDTAEGLVLNNGFNLNSTSALAWEKVLSGQCFGADSLRIRNEQGDFPDPAEWVNVEHELNSVFFNHPQTSIYNLTEREDSPRYEFVSRSGNPDYLDALSIDSVDWQINRQHPAFIQPLRELTHENIQDLSTRIVEGLQLFYATNQRPPLSISEFLNANILQDAIDNVPEINNRSGQLDNIPRHTPASITQATLMNALGKLSFVRSDTFKIRAASEVRSPFDDSIISEALCEATFQRTPLASDSPSVGRHFEMIDFRWIRDDL